MKKNITIIALIITMAFSLTACTKMPDLEEDENQLIAEYSTALLLKYDANYTTRLVDTAAIEEERAIQAQKEAEAAAAAAAKAEAEEAAAKAEAEAQAEAEGAVNEPVIEYADIADTLGLTNVTIAFSHIEICNTYPSNPEEILVMKATEGMQLLVLHFNVSNLASEAATVDVASTGAKFRISMNEMENRNALTTMLLDDLSTTSEVIDAGSTVDKVLIIEVTPEEATSITSLDLTMRMNNISTKTRLDL